MQMAFSRRYVLPLLAVGVIGFVFISMTRSSKDTEVLVESVENKTMKVELKTEEQNTADDSLRIWSHDFQTWKRNETVCSDAQMDFEGILSSPAGNIPISIYNPQYDIWVSRRIADHRDFDGWKRDVVIDILYEDENLNFIDFGCNIGVYTLSAAKLGRKALCIYALYLHVQHVCASVLKNNFQNKIDVVLNAVSATHENVQMAVDMKNMGGTFVDKDADFVKKVKGKTVSGNHYSNITTITVNDLLTLPVIGKFQKVFINMDIEGFEARALEKADDFFKGIFVKGILMEWIFHAGKKSGLTIVEFMTRHRFRAHSVETQRILPHSPNGRWSLQDVLWLRT